VSQVWQALHADTERPAYAFGTRRTVAPTQTLRRIAPLLPRAGITRLADVTGLDWIGLPVYQAVRPNSRNLSVAQGKGLTRAQAKVSALMESLESFHAERVDLPAVTATVGEMRRQLDYDPYALPVVRRSGARDIDYDAYAPPLGSPSLLQDDAVVEWVRAVDLAHGLESWVPRQLCELDFRVQERWCAPLFRASSNGLASGNTFAEAVLHGLCEVVERDSLFRRRHTAVMPKSISSRLVQRLLRRFDAARMETEIFDETGPTGVPCYHVYLRHPESRAQYYGSGCNPNAVTALVRALTEAAQSRLSHIAGSRDDFTRRTYTSAFAARPVRAVLDFPATTSVRLRSIGETAAEVVLRIRKLTGTAPLAVDLSRPDFDLPVVFVVAPGLTLHPPTRR
jgi:ribosomal protein S12 methylthiotransferase accessory factor